MPARRWGLPFIALGLVAPAFWAAGQAQDSVPSSPPELRDFELKPSSDLDARIGRTPRPEPEPGLDATIKPPAQAPVVTPEQPVRLQPSAPAPQSTRPAAQEPAPSRAPARAAPRQPAPAAPAPAETLPLPPAVEAIPPQETAAPAPAPAPAPVAQAEPAPLVAPDDAGLPWLNILLGALAALGIGYALLERRKATRARAEAELAESRAAAQAEAARRAREAERARAAPAPEAPKAAPAPAPAPLAATEDRPWIELDFAPETATATDRDAQVQYRLAIRNAGNSPARNVRIETRMFNIDAEQRQEIAAFFAAPVSGAILPPRTIPEAGAIEHRGVVAMPREEMRAITVEGRSLFIPVVAFNVLYEWGDGRTGQTALSYVVGREIGPASEKMGPFRLDLGPRLYRSVGQRRNQPALVT